MGGLLWIVPQQILPQCLFWNMSWRSGTSVFITKRIIYGKLLLWLFKGSANHLTQLLSSHCQLSLSGCFGSYDRYGLDSRNSKRFWSRQYICRVWYHCTCPNHCLNGMIWKPVLKFMIQKLLFRFEQQSFADLQGMLYEHEYQLLWDVNVHWSSTLLMIDRFLLLREVCNLYKCVIMLMFAVSQAITQFLDKDLGDFAELHKYSINDDEWKLLKIYADILRVCIPISVLWADPHVSPGSTCFSAEAFIWENTYSCLCNPIFWSYDCCMEESSVKVPWNVWNYRGWHQ